MRAIRIVHVYFSSFTNESRARRAAQAVRGRWPGADVLFLGHRASDLPEEAVLDGIARIRRLPTPGFAFLPRSARRLAQYGAWMRSLDLALRDAPVDVLHCHGLAALAAASTLRRRPETRIVYDAHELESERVGWRPVTRRLARTIERRLVRRVDQMLVVNESIKNWYAREYGLKDVEIVRNVPIRGDGTADTRHDFHEEFGLPASALVFLYQGLIAEKRGADFLIDVFSRLGPDHHLVFLGHGAELPRLRELARDIATVHFKDSVPPEALLSTTRGADVGLCVIDDLCLSYRYCLPNKLFEYFAAEVPVVVSDLPELRAAVERYHAGWVSPYRVDSMADLIARLRRPEISRVAAGLRERSQDCAWEHEQAVLLRIYERLVDSEPVPSS